MRGPIGAQHPLDGTLGFNVRHRYWTGIGLVHDFDVSTVVRTYHRLGRTGGVDGALQIRLPFAQDESPSQVGVPGLAVLTASLPAATSARSKRCQSNAGPGSVFRPGAISLWPTMRARTSAG